MQFNSTNVRKCAGLLLVLLTLTGASDAAAQSKDLFPTPNAASIGRFGEIPVGFFNGLPGINIPLYQLAGKNLSVPVSLSYHASGVRPGQHGSWVGVNWSLMAGGVITRIKNDYNDDYVQFVDGVTERKRGHYYNPGELNSIDWTNTKSIEDGIMRYEDVGFESLERKDKAADEFSFNFLGMSGSFMLGQDGNWKLKCAQQGLVFNVEVATGRYGFTYPTSQYESNPEPATRLYNIFTKFTLVGSDGTRYEFGGTNASIEFSRTGRDGYFHARDAGITATSWYLTRIVNPYGEEITFDYERKGYQIVASSSSSAHYHHAEGTLMQSCWMIGKRNCEAENHAEGARYLGLQFYIQDPVYLRKITSSQGSVEFVSSRSGELDYPNQRLFSECLYYGPEFRSLWDNHCTSLLQAEDIEAAKTRSYCNTVGGQCLGGPVSKWFKLDAILVRNAKNEMLKEFNLSYFENPGSRLFLTSLQEKNGSVTLPAYQFKYYGAYTDLPPYLTYKVDHWGYYNGTSEIDDIINSSRDFPDRNYFPPASFLEAYGRKKEPNATAMLTGTLQQISYPTGGTTEFTYEPHSYAKVVNTQGSSFPVEERNHDKTAGGLRIKKMVSKGLLNTPDLTNTYYYVRDYLNGNLLSSGVLSSREPQYVEEGSTDGSPTLTYKFWQSNNILPAHQTNGNHVTYTHVAEVDQDGGFKVYTYSNHDNGYRDREAEVVAVAARDDFWLRNASSVELERGLLLNEKVYSGQKHLLQEVRYEYNDTPDRFGNIADNYRAGNNHVRYLRSNPKTFDFGAQGSYYYVNTAALVFYSHFPSLKRVTRISYDQHDPAKSVQSSTAYQYNWLREVSEQEKTNSDGTTLVTSTSYAGEFVILNQSNAAGMRKALALMGQKHMINSVVEQYTYRKGSPRNPLSGTLYTYRQNEVSPDQVVPGEVFALETNKPLADFRPAHDDNTQFVFNAHYHRRQAFEGYDERGNLSQTTVNNNVPTAYAWDYNKDYPVAKVVNARNQVLAANFRSTARRSINPGGPVEYAGSRVTTNFTVDYTGTVRLKMGNPFVSTGSTSWSLTISYSLSGEAGRSGSLSLSKDQPCGYDVVEFTNVPPGAYTLTVQAGTNVGGNPTVSACGEVEYPQYAFQVLKEFFYQGFEGTAPDNFVKDDKARAHLGHRFYEGDYTPAFTIPNARNYVIEYHYLDAGNQWNHVRKEYTNNLVLSEGVAIDEVRIYPADAMMTTYTYDPLVGMTSQTGPDGATLTYGYDDLGRLLWIKDHLGNLVKHYEYHYKQ